MFSLFALAVGAVLATGGCGGVPAGGAVAVRSSLPRAAGTVDGARAVAHANAGFAGRLYASLARETGTFAFSPYSIGCAMAMTAAGAHGQTLSEIERALGVGGDRLHTGFNGLDRQLAARARDGVRLDIANALWGQRGTRFGRAFLDTLARNYGAGMELVDYRADASAARNAINRWVAQRTHGNIRDLLPPGAVDRLTRLVLVDAVYLKADWAARFDRDETATGSFHTAQSRVPVRLMHQTATLGYRRGRDFQVVELPYRGERLALDVILPDRGRLAAVERAVTERGVDHLVAGADPTYLRLALPKLRLAAHFELVDTLKALGVRRVFSDRADLSAISSDEQLTVGRVVHQATLAMDENGTEASAATGVVVRAVSAPPTPEVVVRVDRPFLFALRDRTTGALLFLGRVLDPHPTSSSPTPSVP